MNEFLRQSADIYRVNELAKVNLASLVINAEECYQRQIRRMKERFNQGNYKVILLSGPSSSGKTTTSNLIRKSFSEDGIHSIVISLDNFYINRDKTPLLPDGSYDFENIYALDLEYFSKFLDDLLTNHKAKCPEYDFLTGSRKKEMIDIEIDDNTVVIFEGIHALNPLLLGGKHGNDVYKIYVCLNTNFETNGEVIIPAKELRLMRRMLRDFNSRGYSIPATIDMWKNVLDGEEKYIKPFKDDANFLIDTTHLYEPLLYAHYLRPLLEKVEDNPLAKTILLMLSQCGELDKTCVPSQSLLWEFLVY